MKKDLLCSADQLHFSLEVLFRECPEWKDAYICADEKSVYAVRINREDLSTEIKDILHGNSSQVRND